MQFLNCFQRFMRSVVSLGGVARPGWHHFGVAPFGATPHIMMWNFNSTGLWWRPCFFILLVSNLIWTKNRLILRRRPFFLFFWPSPIFGPKKGDTTYSRPGCHHPQQRLCMKLLCFDEITNKIKQFSVKSTEPIQLKTFFYCLRFEIILISLSKLIYEQAQNLNKNKQIWNYVIKVQNNTLLKNKLCYRTIVVRVLNCKITKILRIALRNSEMVDARNKL